MDEEKKPTCSNSALVIIIFGRKLQITTIVRCAGASNDSQNPALFSWVRATLAIRVQNKTFDWE